MLDHLNGLWSYATTEWLRLTIPSDDDKTRSRWPIHPLWLLLSSVDWETDGGPLGKRFSPTRSPNDDKLLQMACSAFSHSWPSMALTVPSSTKPRTTCSPRWYNYIEDKAYDFGLPFDDYVEERIGLAASSVQHGDQ